MEKGPAQNKKEVGMKKLLKTLILATEGTSS